MKFGRNLPRNQVPEWSSSYINYKSLKKLIKSAVVDTKTTGDADLAEFFFSLDRNLETIDTFYNKKFGESSRRLKLLHDRYGTTKELLEGVDRQEAEELLAALLELRGQFRNLQWYGEVNRRGFIKITKKLDKKVHNVCAQRQYLESRVEPKQFAANTELTAAMKSINEWISTLGDAPIAAMALSNGTSSKKYAPHLPSSFTSALDSHFRKDDSQELDVALSKTLSSSSPSEFAGLDENTVLLNLLQRAIACKAKQCMALLLKKTKSLDESNDINGRNCVHRLVIAIGRASTTGDEEKTADMTLTIPTDHNKYISPATTPILQPPSGHRKSESVSSLGAENDSVKLLSSLLEHLQPHQRNALIARDSYGRTPLHYAAQYGFITICNILIEKMRLWNIFDVSEGIDHTKWQDNEGWAPLHLAVIGGHPLTTKLLLEAEESSSEDEHVLEARQTVSRSGIVLALAVKANFVTIVQLLVDAGVDVSYQDSDGETALHVAARFGHTDCARILIDGRSDAGRNISALELPERTFAWTPLFIAAVDGHRPIVELFLSYNIDAERKDLSGWTAKEHAALRGHIEIAHIIAEHIIATKTQQFDCNGKRPPISSSPSSISSLEEKKSSVSKAANGLNRTSEPVKAFGHRYLTNESMILVSLGSMDMRKDIEPVTLDQIPIADAHSTQLDTALSLVVSAKGAKGEPTIIDLPVQDNLSTEPVVFTAVDPTNVRLLFDIVPTYAGTKDKIVGRGAAMLGSVKQSIGTKRINLQGDISVPIIAADTLEVIGSVHFNFLVITPFSHPNMSITEKKTYWKSLASTMVIGHRGLGKNQPSRKSLQLGENTIQSFVAASNLGANYIEFDVQLTKDHVPVIYHDFLVSETGIDAPVHTLTLEQFLHVGEAATPRTSRPPTPPRTADPRISLIRDPARRTRSLSAGRSFSDSVADMSERMKHTRDFKIKGYKGNSLGAFIKEKFATLDQMFQHVPLGTGFNIEMKYPMLHESEEQEMDTYAIDLNTFVDTVLTKVYDKNTGAQRRDIIFSSFNPDICLLLSFKQPSIPVLFLTDAGTEAVGDIRASSLQEAIRFASRWNLLGVVTAAEPVVVAPRLIRVVKESGLVCISYGVLNNDPVHVQTQADQEIDAVIVDSLITVREGLRIKAASEAPTPTPTTPLSGPPAVLTNPVAAQH